MNTRERLYLVIFAVLLSAMAVLVGGAALSLYPLEVLQDTVGAVYGHLEYAILAVLLLALAVWAFLTSVRRKNTVESLAQPGPLGEVSISFKAIENLVLKATRNVNGVRDIKTRIVYTESGLVIYLRATTLPDEKIPELTAGLQAAVKEYVESSTGSTVAEIKVLIENVVTDTIKATR
ncbi:MAG TPA: alkaline shock response membrane anchor protein AmaP [Oscillospiraceae bacterium]|nr:alkaline shock response membrane anchor protein AmaP [Oscillospiraceae bacterium]